MKSALSVGRDASIARMLERMRATWTLEGDGVAAERAAFVALSKHFPEPTDMDERWDTIGGVACLVTQPAHFDAPADPTILYFHGGAFLIGSAEIYRYQSSQLARAARARVITVDYRLAPEHPFPAAIDDAQRAFQGLVELGYDPARIIIAGDSAGGNLSLVTAMRQRDEDGPLPAGLVLLSPWVDLTCSGASMQDNANDRHLAQQPGLLVSARTYLAGEHDQAPLASPLFGDLDGLPPVLIQVGSLETLLSESLELDRNLAAAATEVRLQVFEGMVHEWHLLSALLEPDEPLVEANQAIEQIAAFVRERSVR